MKNINEIAIEGARIRFRNLKGEPDKFNKAGGKRTFAVLINPEDADPLIAEGWNIKFLKPREDEEVPQPYLSVEAKYGNFPPRVYLIADGKKTELTEDSIGTLDYAEIENVDLIIRPYCWEMNGNHGVKAYLKTMYVTVKVDKFAEKYSDFDSGVYRSSAYDEEIVNPDEAPF